MITIYTDGSSLGNPGPGGWGVLILQPVGGKKDPGSSPGGQTSASGGQIELSGGEERTTNNRMELSAVIYALKWLVDNSYTDQQTTIHMDSMYVHSGIEKYLPSWIARGWRLANKKPVLNKDLWMEVHMYLGKCPNVIWKRVKAHATSKYNNKVDKLARNYAYSIQSTLPSDYKPPVIEPSKPQKSLFS